MKPPKSPESDYEAPLVTILCTCCLSDSRACDLSHGSLLPPAKLRWKEPASGLCPCLPRDSAWMRLAPFSSLPTVPHPSGRCILHCEAGALGLLCEWTADGWCPLRQKQALAAVAISRNGQRSWTGQAQRLMCLVRVPTACQPGAQRWEPQKTRWGHGHLEAKGEHRPQPGI